jgi:hypothetical protein
MAQKLVTSSVATRGVSFQVNRDSRRVRGGAGNGFRTGAAGGEPGAEFVFGPERAAYEAGLTPVLQDRLAELLAGRPPSVRQYLRGLVYQAAVDDPSLGSLEGRRWRRLYGR